MSLVDILDVCQKDRKLSKYRRRVFDLIDDQSTKRSTTRFKELFTPSELSLFCFHLSQNLVLREKAGGVKSDVALAVEPNLGATSKRTTPKSYNYWQTDTGADFLEKNKTLAGSVSMPSLHSKKSSRRAKKRGKRKPTVNKFASVQHLFTKKEREKPQFPHHSAIRESFRCLFFPDASFSLPFNLNSSSWPIPESSQDVRLKIIPPEHSL